MKSLYTWLVMLIKERQLNVQNRRGEVYLGLDKITNSFCTLCEYVY